MKFEIINLKEVIKITNLSRSTVLRLVEAGRFPKKLKLSARRIGWVKEEVLAWIAESKEVKQ